ncbi:hypothetical protein [Aquabacterium sp.]|uniref:hypothetical protein n=1 Tax=Aquabacterium sp. TaxID=1872578 RepID=UPI0037830E68
MPRSPLPTLAAALALTAGANLARADEPAAPRDGLSVDTDAVIVDVTPQRALREPATGGPTQYASGTRTMLWSRRGAVQWGLGLEQPAAQAAGMLQPGLLPAPRMLLGASLDTSASTQLQWRTPVPAGLARDGQEPPRTMELSLVLKPSDSLAALRRGALMRLELSGQTQLSLRPRGGRLGLLLTSKW